MKPLKTGLRAWHKVLLLLLLAVVLLGLAGAVLAFENITLDWHVIAGGGISDAGGRTKLSGTLGQPIIGVSSGSGISLRAGFWAGLPAAYRIYLPIAVR